ncbi:uncharacterized protein LOC123555176 [Mercenaria mercenaria]|uniref:uncharacterized protein LOC123555176 n=1 Tax=Mercenaria mercenaria TaxID=6596 RepID=UPI00234F78AD|nr:uncharacterized protein LOC123555176 [Mercenaria mercenaria]
MNVQTEYYIRLLLTLVQGGMLVCKGIIDRELAGITLDVILKAHEPKLKKKLIKSQYLVLFPKSGTPDVEDLDLSVLTVVLQDVINLAIADKQHIKIIKETRNTLAHNSTASVELSDYNTLKTDLEDALTKLCLGLDVTLQTECSKLIQKFTSEPLDEATALKYVKELRNEDELLQDFEGMLDKQSKDIVQEVRASENRLQESLSDFKQEVIEGFQKIHSGYTDDFTHSTFPDTLPDCEVCSPRKDTATATFYCEACCQFMCIECNQRIHTVENTHNRKRIVKRKPLKIDMKGYDKCDDHKKNISYICESDNELCCEVCVEEKHENCLKVTSISEDTMSYESKYNPTMEIPRLQNEAHLLITWLSSIERDVNKNVKSIPAKLDEYRNVLLKQFDSEAQKIKEKADEMKNNTLKEIKKKRKYCEHVVQKCKRAKLSLINMTKCGTTPQKLISQYRIEELRNEFQSLTDVDIVSLHMELKLPEQIALHSELLPVRVEAPGTRPVQLFQIGVLELKQNENKNKEPFYSGLDFLPDGRLVTVDNYNCRCLIYNEKLEEVGSFQLSYNPQCVVAVSEEEVAITSRNPCKIDFLHVSKSNEITLIRTCKVTTKYMSICLKDDKNFVVGTVGDTRHVRIVSMSGEEKDFSINFQNKKYSLDTSACTYIRNSDRVVLTDSYKHTVFIYDTTTNTTVSVKNDQIREPKNVAVGPFDCIFVCSMRRNSIVQISPLGKVIASHKIDMTSPSSICFSKDKTRLAISNCAGGEIKLQLFKVVI